MISLKNKKIIGISAISIILFISSIFLYRQNSGNAFKEEYMTEIFTEESETIDETNDINDVSVDASSTIEDSQEVSSNKNKIVVEIKGEVISPDVYELEEGSIIKDLIEASGGLTDEADISNINRAQELSNHQLIIIGNINDTSENNILENTSIESGVILNNSNETSDLININTADVQKLQCITGIGEVKAQSIIEYRESNGGFKSIDELKNVSGIGDKTFEKIKDQITV